MKRLMTVVGMAMVAFVMGCDGEGQTSSVPGAEPANAPEPKKENEKNEKVEPNAPLGAEIVVDTLEEPNGNVYRTGRAHFQNADDTSLLRTLIAPDLDSGLGMEKESCKAISVVGGGKPAAGVREVNVGPKFTLVTPGQTIVFVDRTTGDGYGYSIPSPAGPPSTADAVPPRSTWAIMLTPESDDAGLGSWKGVFESAPALDMKSEDFKNYDAVPFPKTGYQLEYASSSAQLMTATIGGGYSKTKTVCRLDPEAIAFTIRQDLLEAVKAGLDPRDAALYVTIAVYAYVKNTYTQGGAERTALSVHRRLRQVQIKID